MARKRMIDPKIWESEDFSKLSLLAKFVFIGLFSNADDEGRGNAKPAYIRNTLFRFQDDVRASDIDKSLDEIAAHMSVAFYLFENCEYYEFLNWYEWQKIDRPTPSRYPPRDSEGVELTRNNAKKSGSTNTRRILDEGSTNTRRGLDEGSSKVRRQ